MAWFDPNHYLPWTSFRNDLLAWLALMLIASSMLARRAPLEVPRFAAGASLLSLWPLAQFASGTIFFFGDALLAALYLAGFGWAVVVAYATAGEERQAGLGWPFADLLAGVFVAGALLSLLIALGQWLSLDLLGIWQFPIRTPERLYGNLGQPNNLASLLLIGCAATFYLRLAGKWGEGLSTLVIVLLLAGVAMTQSRMALLALTALLLWLAVGQRRLAWAISRWWIVGIGLLGLSLWLFFPLCSAWLLLAPSESADRLAAASSDPRLLMWTQLLDAAWRRPWFGWGWNQVSVAQLAVAANYPHSLFTEHAHNLLIDLLVWIGIPAGLVVFLAIMVWLVARLRQIATLPGWFGMAAVLILGTHALLEFPLDYAFFLMPLGLFIGIIEASAGARAVWHLPGRGAALVWLLGAALCLTVALEYLKVEDDSRRLRFEAIGIEKRSPEHMAPDVMLLTQQREFLRFARTEAKEKMSDAELEWMRQVSSRYPYPPSLYRYALASGINGRYQEASAALLALRQLHAKKYYDEAADGWQALILRYPALKNVDFPPRQKANTAS